MLKILKPKKLANIIEQNKKNKLTTVMCHGAFDVLHYGHIAHFEEAKENGDKLVVSVTADKFINKGPNRPFFSEDVRMKTIAALDIVDYVVLSESDISISMISAIKPDIYCKGPDYKNHKDDISGNIKKEIREIKKVGGKIIYTKGKTYSSSKLINIFSDQFNEDQKRFLNKIKSKHTSFYINNMIDKISKLNVLCIGETIIDEYVFCKAIGKSGKEPVLVLQEMEREKYLGGVGMVANNISEFINKSNIFTVLGERDTELNFIKSNLKKKIKLNYLKKKNSPTILKRRFVDYIDKKKLLGVYDINDQKFDEAQEKTLINKLKDLMNKSDTIIVVDYGHGILSSNTANLISRSKNFTAINAQINSFNIGFQKIDKYKKPDLLIINESELRHDLRDNLSSIDKLVKKVSKSIYFKKFVVTCGSKGSYLYSKRKDKIDKIFCPAFASKIVDKIGSGDAMLSMTSICIRAGLSDDLSLFIGSIAAAKSVENIGNSYTLKKVDLLKTINHILK